jgi:GxxExxY protein
MGAGEIENKLSKEILNAAFLVHSELGPGLLESAYEACLIHELRNKNLLVEVQKPMPLIYHGLHLETGYRIDILVENKVIVEVKSLESILPVHWAQVLTYMKLSECNLGLLLNFNVKSLKEGIKRFVL